MCCPLLELAGKGHDQALSATASCAHWVTEMSAEPRPEPAESLLSPDSLMQVWTLLLTYPVEVWECVALVHAGV